MESYESAEQLASTIRIGSLKVELEEIQSKVVGAQLGADAIRTSLLAGIIGFALVVIFMIIMYRLPGVAAGIALTSYVGITLGLLNAFEITLTLPGIAGIILGIGMAVDANVIIFARIREEIGAGKSVKGAIRQAPEGAVRYSGRQHHHADCGDYPEPEGLRIGQGLCPYAGFKYRGFHVYGPGDNQTGYECVLRAGSSGREALRYPEGA